MTAGFQKGSKIEPGYVSPEFQRRLDALRGSPAPVRRAWFHPDDVIAFVVALGIFAVICGGRCG